MSRVAFVVLLAALTALPPLSIDVSLPGFPVIAHALHASRGAMQSTLSVFMLAFAGGQLLLGPLSDRYGRRPVLLAGLAIYTLAGIACTLAATAPWLLVARFVQGFGACSGTVIARAIVRDVSAERDRAASLQAAVSAVQIVAPIAAPLLGAALLAVLGWRSLYGALVLAGVALVLAVWLGLRETATRNRDRVLVAYVRALRRRQTVPLAFVAFGAFFAYFAMISGSPFALVTQMHVSSALFSVAFAFNACALLAGALLVARLAPRVGAERLFALGVAGISVAGVLALLCGAFVPTPLVFTAMFAAVGFCEGIVIPSAYGAGLAGAGSDAGLTSGVLGASQFFGGALGSALAGALPLAPSASLGIVACAGTFVCGGAYLLARLSVRGAEEDELDVMSAAAS